MIKFYSLLSAFSQSAPEVMIILQLQQYKKPVHYLILLFIHLICTNGLLIKRSLFRSYAPVISFHIKIYTCIAIPKTIYSAILLYTKSKNR